MPDTEETQSINLEHFSTFRRLLPAITTPSSVLSLCQTWSAAVEPLLRLGGLILFFRNVILIRLIKFLLFLHVLHYIGVGYVMHSPSLTSRAYSSEISVCLAFAEAVPSETLSRYAVKESGDPSTREKASSAEDASRFLRLLVTSWKAQGVRGERGQGLTRNASATPTTVCLLCWWLKNDKSISWAMNLCGCETAAF